MHGMSTSTDPDPGDRRLDRPPSERYRTSSEEGVARPGSPSRATLLGGLAALLGAIGITVLGGAVAVTVGLVVAAAAVGWLIGLGVRVGAGDGMDQRGRIILAIGFALVSIAVAQVGLWLYGRAEGGVLPFFDYLLQVFGPLPILETVAAVAAAWWFAR
jgi:hypothetical protein